MAKRGFGRKRGVFGWQRLNRSGPTITRDGEKAVVARFSLIRDGVGRIYRNDLERRDVAPR